MVVPITVDGAMVVPITVVGATVVPITAVGAVVTLVVVIILMAVRFAWRHISRGGTLWLATKESIAMTHTIHRSLCCYIRDDALLLCLPFIRLLFLFLLRFFCPMSQSLVFLTK